MRIQPYTYLYVHVCKNVHLMLLIHELILSWHAYSCCVRVNMYEMVWLSLHYTLSALYGCHYRVSALYRCHHCNTKSVLYMDVISTLYSQCIITDVIIALQSLILGIFI